ncbi:hypothetical protein [Mammaliicoccus sciuri]|uniref:hypothetical protein n=1 Tax=Mammaliicoccus sciuri TaxID=1296 RepID=UPI000D1F67D6|nr:hypothetical protein [Mammaliicoccus sciuri]PTK22730.1 hypothetical protein BUZ86_14080 [Mammaliicoccus sciuri]
MIAFLCRNKKVMIIIIVLSFFIVYIDYSTKLFDVLTEIQKREQLFSLIETIVSFSSITTAFLFFGVSFIPLISDDNKIMKIFRNKEKNYEEFIVCAIQFLLVSTISILIYLLYIVDLSNIKCLLLIMITLLLSSILNMILLFYDLLKDISKKINQ